VQALGTATAPYFFLSYAHRSRDDGRDEGEPDAWVSDLFNDLDRAVTERVGLPRGRHSGYMDRERRTGNDWPIGVVQALTTCRVLLPLYSGRFFADEYCGREWNFFVSRARDTAAQEAAIVPAVWEPVEPGRLPEAARAAQSRHRGSEGYEASGLYELIKLSRYRTQYEEAVTALAGRIVAMAVRLPAGEALAVDYQRLESAFGRAGQARAAVADKPLRITVIAPRRDQLPSERSQSAWYGTTALEWKPYDPASGATVAGEATALARSLEFRAEVGELSQHEKDLLSGDPRSGPQILIVDPWALLVPPIQQLLHRLDSRHLPWVQVLIVWNAADDESRNSEDKLRVALDATLRQKLKEVAVTSATAARGVPSQAAFEVVLGQLIGAAARRYLNHAAAHPPRGELVERPRIS
jgi:FxsC-like protein